jgi:hypothetical protein
MDVARMPKKWPGSLVRVKLKPRCSSTARSIIPSALRPHPHAHITRILRRRAYSKHGEEAFFKLTSADSQLKISTLSRDKTATLLTVLQPPMLHQIYQTPVVDPRRVRLLWAQKSFNGGSRLPRNDPSTSKRQRRLIPSRSHAKHEAQLLNGYFQRQSKIPRLKY